MKENDRRISRYLAFLDLLLVQQAVWLKDTGSVNKCLRTIDREWPAWRDCFMQCETYSSNSFKSRVTAESKRFSGERSQD